MQKIPPYDSVWVEKNQKKAALKLEKLDSEMKNYKSNAIKASIRRGHDELGDHFLDCGDLNNAMKCYSRARLEQPRTTMYYQHVFISRSRRVDAKKTKIVLNPGL